MYWALRMGKNTNTLVGNNVINFFKNRTKQRKIVLEYSFELIFCINNTMKLYNEYISQIQERYRTYTSI